MCRRRFCLRRDCSTATLSNVTLHSTGESEPAWTLLDRCGKVPETQPTRVSNPYHNSRNHCSLSVSGECNGAVGFSNTFMLLKHKMKATGRKHDTEPTVQDVSKARDNLMRQQLSKHHTKSFWVHLCDSRPGLAAGCRTRKL